MASPRRPRRMTVEDFVAPNDPVEMAAHTDRQALADELAEVYRSLEGVDENRITASLFRLPDGGLGKFQWLEDLSAPFDIQQIRAALKAKYGGGKYRLQIFVDKITRRNVEINIAGEAVKPAGAGGDSIAGNGVLAVMLQMQEAARREASDARREDFERRRLEQDRDRDRTTAMWTAIAAIAPVALPLLLNREKLTDLLALVNSNKQEPQSLKDQIETVVLLKKAFGDDKGGDFDPSDVVGSLARLAGPALAAAGRAIGGRGAPGGQGPAEEPAYDMPPLPLPQPAAAPPAADRPAGGGEGGAGQLPPLLQALKGDILYFYGRSHDPALAADALVDIMTRGGVTDEAVNGLVAAFGLSADWKADLAAAGLDLRGNPGWADDFLAELVDAWTNRERPGDASAGGAGGLADAADDAAPGAGGLALDDGEAARA